MAKTSGRPPRTASATILSRGAIPLSSLAAEQSRILRESEERYRSVVSALSDGVVLQDADGRITMCNAAAELILGVPAAQLIGRTSLELASPAIHEDGRPFLPEERPSALALRTNTPVRGVVLGLPRPSGAHRWIKVNAEPIRGSDGQPISVASTFSDITEPRRVQAALETSQAHLAQILDAGTDGYWERELSSKTLFQSARMNAILGNEVADSEVSLDALFARVHPDELPALRSLLVGVLTPSQERFAMELRVRRPDGAWGWVSTVGKVIDRDADGRPLRLAGTIADIHQRKTAEQALAVSERRYRDLAALSPVPIFINREDRVDQVNRAAVALWGAAHAGELLGREVKELFHPDSSDRVTQRFSRALDGAAPVLADQRIVRLDGTVRVVEAAGAPFIDDRGLAVQVVLRDVTEERRAESELRASEIRFRTLAERAPAGVFEANLQGRLAYFNRALADLIGTFTPGVWFELVHPDDRERVRAEWAADREGSLTSEYRLLGPSGGASRLVRADVTALRDLSGRRTGFTGVVVDIGERLAQLEQFAVNARLQALATFVAGVAHEVNNPLAAVVSAHEWSLDALRTMLAGPGPERPAPDLREIIQALEEATDGTSRITRIVKDLTRFGRQDERRGRVRLAEVVHQVVAWLPPFLVEGSAFEVRGEAPDVLASGPQLAQVLISLTTNASQAIPQGRPGTIRVTLGTGKPGMASLEVSDDGVGITPEVMKRIFDPFFTTRPIRQGMGLGLAVVHAILTANEGTITATSTPGQGSTFRIELPVFREPG